MLWFWSSSTQWQPTRCRGGEEFSLALLGELDILPPGVSWRDDPANLSRSLALVVGDALLRGARLAARLPGDLSSRSPLTANPPYRWRPLGVGFALGNASEYASNSLEQAATMTTLRAWLALERGRTADASRLAKEALEASDLGPGTGGQRLFLPFRSMPLAGLVRQMTWER